ncbi:MAG: CYTH domain-containing protein [Muribaculaceae bacterium]|nr:CYTH domain-containing protein [Muribaculaceae bacterium]
MGKEIERKFLVKDQSFKSMASSVDRIEQGYVSLRPGGTVRVRIKNDRAFITVKGLNTGAVRDEWEYEIPLNDAREMIDRVTEGTVIKKCRYNVDYEGRKWEVDVFEGAHQGLVLAEIELESADAQIELPPFIGEEVTGNPQYYNSVLSGISKFN